MPAKEGLRLDVDQSALPGEEPREKNQRQPCSVGRPPRFDFALEVEGELFPEEHIFRFDRSGRTSAQQQESESILSQRGKYEDQAKHGMRSSHGAGSMPRVSSWVQSSVSRRFSSTNSSRTDFLRRTTHFGSNSGTGSR